MVACTTLLEISCRGSNESHNYFSSIGNRFHYTAIVKNKSDKSIQFLVYIIIYTFNINDNRSHYKHLNFMVTVLM